MIINVTKIGYIGVLFLSGCFLPLKKKSHFVTGYIVTGQSYNYFYVLETEETLLVDFGSQGTLISNYLDKQDFRENIFNGSYGKCRSVYVEAAIEENMIKLPMQGEFKEIEIQKVTKISAPTRQFFKDAESRKLPLPRPIKLDE